MRSSTPVASRWRTSSGPSSCKDEVEMDDELDDGPDIEELTEAVDPSASSAEQDLSDLSMETLNEMLAEAVRNEDYERAARIRDEISRR